MDIDIRNVGKRFDQFVALDDINLSIHDGELVALLGPSGSGKTTLLRVIAGLEQADAGRVLFDGVDASGLDIQSRRAGFVFQHYALFKHMTVGDNIGFGLRVRKGAERPPETKIRERVCELLDLVQLSGLERRYPAQLSGGQRQRVALARALAIEPRVLLLDEPFGALDAQVRRDLRRWLREIHHQTGLTTVFVTHDQEEALELADRVAILDGGRIGQVGAPVEIYERPASPSIYAFIGEINRIRATVAGPGLRAAGLDLPLPEHAGGMAGEAEVFIRPEDVQIDGDAPGWEAVVVSGRQTGARHRLRARLLETGEELDIDLSAQAVRSGVPADGAPVRLAPVRYGVFPAEA